MFQNILKNNVIYIEIVKRSQLPLEATNSPTDDKYDAYLIIAKDLETDLKDQGLDIEFLDDLILLKQVCLKTKYYLIE